MSMLWCQLIKIFMWRNSNSDDGHGSGGIGGGGGARTNLSVTLVFPLMAAATTPCNLLTIDLPSIARTISPTFTPAFGFFGWGGGEKGCGRMCLGACWRRQSNEVDCIVRMGGSMGSWMDGRAATVK